MNRPRRLYAPELEKVMGAQPTSPVPAHRSALPTVTAVMLTRDRLHLTRRCVESMFANAAYPFDLLVYDDGSHDDTLRYLESLQAAHANVTVLAPGESVGFAVARNRAFAAAASDFIFSLDNDMLCHRGWLRETMACAMRHAAAWVAPLRLDPDGFVWAFAADLIRTEADAVIEIARWFHGLPLELVQTLFAGKDAMTNFVPGGLGLFSRQAFLNLGGFDENYGNGFEDVDFAMKLIARGETVWAAPMAVLMHDDQWQPQTAADVDYARSRYAAERLRQSADYFRRRWGFEVLPAKYVTSYAQRRASKVGADAA